MQTNELHDELAKLLEGDVSCEDADLEHVSRDTSLFYVKPSILVYPKNKEDIKKLVSYVADKKRSGQAISLTARAAGTCMTGGPLNESIIFDTTKYMNHVTNLTDTQADAEPGVFYRNFEKETLTKGWLMPSYPASRELSAIGGIVSNNSGGEKTLIYGKTERYVKELDVVYANGESDTVRSLTKEEMEHKMQEQTEGGRIHREIYNLINSHYDEIMAAKPTVSKNSSGYYLWNVYSRDTGTFDLTKLIVGSQGTLAMVTKATITGVVPKSKRRMLVMFLPTTTHLGEIIPKLLEHKPETLESYDDHTFKIAIKFFKDIAMRMGGSMISLGVQFLPEFWMAITGGVPKIILMAEFAGDTDEDVNAQAERAYEDMKQFNLPMKRTKTEQEAKKYWTFRRESFNLLRQRLKGYRTAPTIDDIVVHPSDLPEFLPKLEVVFSKYDLIYTVAGHMGDGNFHIIPLIDIHKEGIIDVLHHLMDEVYELVLTYKGSISGEHNDGLLRTAYLPKMFGENMMHLFEQTKNIFDSQDIFNPGKKVFGNKDQAWSHIDRK
jgi:FAD/FMN-containing dehydrogenase